MKKLVSTLSLLTFLSIGTVVHAADAYPLTTCVVSGEKLNEMGPPVVINYKGTEVHFCCNSCIKKFNANPDQYLAKLKAAQTPAKQ
jgi:YHS domain-containing protein